MSHKTDKLNDLSRRVTQEGATEQPFTGPLLDEKREGTYTCIVCGEPLFSSIKKFDSGSGWPSFTCPIGDGSISEHSDRSLGMKRTEVKCENCDAHLGHVFEDGPKDDTGLRYCINSAALEFTPAE